MKITEDRLKVKGWSDAEIKKTINILEIAKAKKHPKLILLDKAVNWMALLLVIFGNFAFSIFLIPVLVTFPSSSLYLIILLLSSSFGIFMSILIKDLEDLDRWHHLSILLLVPITGIVNFFIVVSIVNSNRLVSILQNQHNPVIVGIIYLIGFFIPYIFLVFDEKWQKVP